jgi:hypothetical protein
MMKRRKKKLAQRFHYNSVKSCDGVWCCLHHPQPKFDRGRKQIPRDASNVVLISTATANISAIYEHNGDLHKPTSR